MALQHLIEDSLLNQRYIYSEIFALLQGSQKPSRFLPTHWSKGRNIYTKSALYDKARALYSHCGGRDKPKTEIQYDIYMESIYPRLQTAVAIKRLQSTKISRRERQREDNLPNGVPSVMGYPSSGGGMNCTPESVKERASLCTSLYSLANFWNWVHGKYSFPTALQEAPGPPPTSPTTLGGRMSKKGYYIGSDKPQKAKVFAVQKTSKKGNRGVNFWVPTPRKCLDPEKFTIILASDMPNARRRAQGRETA